MKDMVRFGILGLEMGANRARVIQNTEGANLVYVCDLQKHKAIQVSKELNCEWTTDYDKMLRRDDIDVIGIYTPSGTHCDYAIQAMETGKHVFVAKPLDIRVDKCDLAIKKSRNTGTILAVDFQERYSKTNQKIKIALDNGHLGRIILGDVRMKWYRNQEYYDGGYPLGWRSKSATDGGVAANQGAHFIDLIQWFMGPVRDVYGLSRTCAHSIETEDLSMAFLIFKSGALGSIVMTTTSYFDLGTSIEITGDKGTVVWKDGRVLLYKCKDAPGASLGEFQPNDSPKNIIADMVSAVRRGTTVMVDGDEGRKSVVVFNAISESSKTGRLVRLT